MKRWLCRRAAALATFALGVMLVSAWGLVRRRPAPPAPPQPAPVPLAAAPPAAPAPDDYRSFEECFVAEDELTHEGYTVRRLFKAVRVEHRRDEGESIQASYAVLKRGGKVLAKFDTLHDTFGNETDFGLFPLTGGAHKQLVVAQRVNRGWAYWIVQLAPAFRVLYDSTDYAVVHDPHVLDVDGDGVQEIVQSDRTFWFWGDFDNVNSPFTEIIFKYDPQSRKYLPANHLLADYALRGIEREIDEVRKLNERPDTADYSYQREARSQITKIVLRYVYAGREKAGWNFYEREYKLGDKWEFQRRVRKELKGSALYRHVYAGAR